MPLQIPYDVPLKILKGQGKSWVLRINGKDCAISLDRLKLTYIEFTASNSDGLLSMVASSAFTPASSSPPTPLCHYHSTHSGRHYNGESDCMTKSLKSFSLSLEGE